MRKEREKKKQVSGVGTANSLTDLCIHLAQTSFHIHFNTILNVLSQKSMANKNEIWNENCKVLK